MPRRKRFEEEVAERVVAPIVLKLLKGVTAQALLDAARENRDVAAALEGTQHLERMRLLVSMFPFAEEAKPRLKSAKWMRWFVENVLRAKRPDLYAVIAYNGDVFKYVARQVRRVVDLVYA